MTITEAHFDFKFKYDRVDSLSKPDFNVAEIDWLLNEAQIVYTKQKYGLNNIYKTGFEGSQKRFDDLKALHVQFPVQPALPLIENVANELYELNFNSLTHDYWFLTSGKVEVIEPACTTEATIKPIQTDDLGEVQDDPFNNSYKYKILYNLGKATTTGSSIYLHSNGQELGNIKVSYLKKPAKVSTGTYVYIDGVTYAEQSFELSEHTHSEIVDLAVKMASQILDHPEFVQLKNAKYMESE
jgi:hypothetical protein